MNKTIIGAVVAIIIVGGGAFYAGMSYAKGQTPARGGGTGQFAARAGGIRGQGGGVTAGQIVSAANGSVTIQMQTGSTQIVLMGTSTQILKSAQGTFSDLTSGTNVVVTGSTNSDGSLTAQSIQIRPAGMSSGQGGFGSTRQQGQ